MKDIKLKKDYNSFEEFLKFIEYKEHSNSYGVFDKNNKEFRIRMTVSYFENYITVIKIDRNTDVFLSLTIKMNDDYNNYGISPKLAYVMLRELKKENYLVDLLYINNRESLKFLN